MTNDEYAEKQAQKLAAALRDQVAQWLVVSELEYKLSVAKARLEDLETSARRANLPSDFHDPRVVIAEYDGETGAVVVEKVGNHGFSYTYAELNPNG